MNEEIKTLVAYRLEQASAAMESFTFPDADLVISTSHCVAKGVIPPPGAFHLSYIHTPMRYAWDQRALVPDRIPRWSTRRRERGSPNAPVGHGVVGPGRSADRQLTSGGLADQALLEPPAEVIPPPVDTEYFTPGGERGENLLTVAALVPYKRVEVAIEVAKRLGRPWTLSAPGRG